MPCSEPQYWEVSFLLNGKLFSLKFNIILPTYTPVQLFIYDFFFINYLFRKYLLYKIYNIWNRHILCDITEVYVAFNLTKETSTNETRRSCFAIFCEQAWDICCFSAYWSWRIWFIVGSGMCESLVGFYWLWGSKMGWPGFWVGLRYREIYNLGGGLAAGFLCLRSCLWIWQPRPLVVCWPWQKEHVGGNLSFSA